MSLLPAPAITLARPFTRLTQAFTSLMCSRTERVADSPVVPQTQTASTPPSNCRSIRRANWS